MDLKYQDATDITERRAAKLLNNSGFKAKINNSINCELIILERTHHDESIIELISKVNIRKTGKLKDGSKLTIKIPIKD